MKEFLAVLSYTFKENVRKKAFIISTLIVIVLSVGLVSVPGIINAVNSKGNNQKTSANNKNIGQRDTIFIVDPTGVFNNNLNEINAAFTSYSFVEKSEADVAALKKDIEKNDNIALVVIEARNGVPNFNYYIKTYGKGLSPDEISNIFKKLFVKNTLKAAKVDDKLSDLVQQDITYQYTELGKGYFKSYLASILICMILFFAIYFFAHGVSMSVASEKTSRVMEILVTSTKPLKIVLGKSVAMGLLGLCQLSSLILATTITYKLTFPKDFTIGGQRIDFSGFTSLTVLMIIIYFILGYSLYAMMNAVAGATVSKAEDVNSAIMPISMISMVSFYFAYFSLMSPTGNVAVAASLIPFSAPFSMPCRIIATDVPAWQILMSLFILIASIILIAWLSIKIYSSAVLHYGKRLKLKDLFNRIK